MGHVAASPGQDRRWAGAFRQCTSCGGRNWVGARRCRACDSLLVGAPAVAQPPVAMIGRRAADRVMTRRVKAAVAGGVVIALGGGLLLLQLLRADAFQTSPALAGATPAPSAMAADVGVGPSLASEPAMAAPGAAEALRLAARGRTLMERGNVRGAVEALSEAARLLPDDAEVAHLFGAALWRFGAQDRAIFQLRRALLIARDNPVFREDLARALQNAGHDAEAVRVLREGETIGVSTLPADTAAMGLTPQPSGDGVNMGGAGNGRYAGRTSFTDADLHATTTSGQGVAPKPPGSQATPAAAAPSPEPQQ